MFDQSFSEFGGFGNSPAGAVRKERRVESPTLPILPSKLKEIASGEENIVINGQGFNNVILVGKVMSESRTSVKVEYTIADTDASPDEAKIEAFIDEDPAKNLSVVEGMWIKVFGKITSFQGQATITVFKMFKVENEKEIELHRLEARVAQLFHEKDVLGKIQPGSCGAAAAGSSMGGAGGGQVKPVPFGGNKPADTPMADNSAHGLTGLNGQIYTMLRAHSNENPGTQGMHTKNIKQVLPNVSEHAIKEATEFLMNEGHIYSTTDDETFTITG